MLDTCLKESEGDRPQSKQDHTGVRQPVSDHKFTEISVVGNQHAPFGKGNIEDKPVVDAGRIVNGDNSDVMVLRPQPSDQPPIGPFVEKEPDAESAAAEELSQGRLGKRHAFNAPVRDIDAKVGPVITEHPDP